MSDIVERLRQEAERAALCVDSGHDGLCAEAADEIERLRAERDAAISLAERHMDEKHRAQRQAFEDWGALQQRIKTAEAERDRLREALDGVMNSHGEQLHDAFAVANAILKETGHE